MEDRLIALLARSVFPLSRKELIAELGVTRFWLAEVIRVCLARGTVVRVDGQRPAGGLGSVRRMQRFILAGRVPCTPPPEKACARLELDTVVVTPRNHEARVLTVRRNGFFDLEVLGARRDDAYITLHGSLLRAFQPGKPRPDPVRIKGG